LTLREREVVQLFWGGMIHRWMRGSTILVEDLIEEMEQCNVKVGPPVHTPQQIPRPMVAAMYWKLRVLCAS
jgi:hypothetical protein